MGIQSFIVELFIIIARLVIVRPIDTLLDLLQGYYFGGKKNEYLGGNFAPVQKELTEYNIPIKQGAIPNDLSGEFVRNGPNPVSATDFGYHWFDGDGMLHGVRMKNGTVSYINRLIQTNVLKNEIMTGIKWRMRLGEYKGVTGLLKVLFQKLKIAIGVISNVGHTANTALVFHNKKLQALVEADVPYEIRILNDGQFETAARLDYNGKLRAMTAHPKVDPKTGELFFFSYSLMLKPYLIYGYIDRMGNLVRSMEVDVPEATMMHDFAITEKHALFLDLCLVFKKEQIITGHIISFDPKHHSRVGILDRYAKDASGIVWFSVPQCMSFHTANAWEEGDEVVLITCKSTSNTFNFMGVGSNSFGLAEWRFNMKTHEFSEQLILPGTICEFPSINPSVLGRRANYVFLGTTASDTVEFDGILKIDLNTNKLVKKFTYGPKKYAGEAVFVPRSEATSEDDGYLLTFVFDQNSNSSSFWIIDAKSMTDIVAIVDLPQRVPYGFHGLFVSEEEIKSQLKK